MSQNGSSSKSAHGANGESFEESFKRLQEVVRKLSEGNLSLQDSLASFEDGMRLAERCSAMLDEAELRVRQASEKAMQEGMASLASLDQRGASHDEGALVEVEVESFEATVLLDAARQGLPPRRADPGTTSTRPRSLDEIDPLFDEDD